MREIKDQKETLAYVSRLAYDRHLVGAAGGNVSVRVPDSKQMIITSGGISLRDITVNELITVDLDGNIIEGKQGLRPSKETSMHAAIYQERPDVNAIIHVHPPYATAFAIQGKVFPLSTASSSLKLKKIPLINYAPPGSQELARKVSEVIKKSDEDIISLLLERHGVIAFGRNIMEVFDTAELIEETAKVMFISSLIP